jgi:hypothetical protein
MNHPVLSSFEQESKKELVTKEKVQNKIDIHNLNIEDRQKLMNSFAWLIQEDKKQNPAFYQINETVA